MKVDLLLADSGEVDPNGKLHALGIGWTSTVSPTPPMVVILILQIMPTETDILGHPLTINVSIRTQDGEQFLDTDPDGGSHPIQIQGDAMINPSAELQAGLPISTSLVLPIGPGIPLLERRLYSWDVAITAKEDDRALASDSSVFYVSRLVQPIQQPQAHSKD